MSYTEIFYWLTVADNAKTFFGVFAIFFCAVFVITQIVRAFLSSEDELDENNTTKVNKWTWYSTPFMLLFLTLWIFTPSKKDALLIVAGGQTLDFLSKDKSARQIPHELSNFVLTELKSMAKDAEVDLNIKDQKNKIVQEVKSMTGEQILEKMKTDSTFSKTMQGLIKDE